MGGVQEAPQKQGKKGPLGRHKRKRVGIRVDMTPMVDVAFLLLIFFMVTTVFRRPLAMEVNLPEPDVKVEVPISNVMTLYVLPEDQMVYDVGERGYNPVRFEELRETFVLEVDYNPDLIVLVKIHREATYENMVNILDLLDDAQMQRFSVVPMTPDDEAKLEGAM